MKKLLAVFLLIVALLALDVWRFTRGMYAAISPRAPETIHAVDVIAVLTGGQGRLKEAVAFLAQGRGKYLFISGIRRGTPVEDIFEANHVPVSASEFKDRIYLGDVSQNTIQNALEVREIVERLNAKSVLVVTSTYHMRRALELIRAELARKPKLDVELDEYPVESPNFDRERWWESATGWRILLSEYFKSRALGLGY
jgi:uncharacterized SAM-binding protein YcdF (DUF218 family)